MFGGPHRGGTRGRAGSAWEPEGGGGQRGYFGFILMLLFYYGIPAVSVVALAVASESELHCNRFQRVRFAMFTCRSDSQFLIECHQRHSTSMVHGKFQYQAFMKNHHTSPTNFRFPAPPLSFPRVTDESLILKLGLHADHGSAFSIACAPYRTRRPRSSSVSKQTEPRRRMAPSGRPQSNSGSTRCCSPIAGAFLVWNSLTGPNSAAVTGGGLKSLEESNSGPATCRKSGFASDGSSTSRADGSALRSPSGAGGSGGGE